MKGMLTEIRRQGGGALAPLLALFLVIQVGFAGYALSLSPSDGGVFCGPAGTQIALDGDQDGSGRRFAGHCPYCVIGAAVASAPPCEAAAPRLLILTVLAPTSAARVAPRPPLFARRSRAPPRIA